MHSNTLSCKLFYLILFFAAPLYALGQPPTLLWQRSIGGSDDEYANSMFQYADGYAIVCVGRTNSGDGDFSGCGNPLLDVEALVTKTDSSGNFYDCFGFGGSGYDEFNKGMFVVPYGSQIHLMFLGRTTSNDRDVSGNHGSFDAWLVRTMPNGTIISQKCIGGTGWEDAFDFIEMPDKGFMICGISSSDTIDGLPTGNHGSFDAWIVRTDSIGNIIWNKMFGGSGEDWFTSIVKTFDGNFVLSGFTSSIDGDITNNQGQSDYFMMKIDSSGNVIWNKTYGGSNDEYSYQVIQTKDSGLVFTGYTYSFDGDVSGNVSSLGESDVWLIKTNSNGNVLWKYCYGSTGSEISYSVYEDSDRNIIVPAFVTFEDNIATGCGVHGQCCDPWVFKVDSTGNLLWQKCFGSNSLDWVFSDIVEGTAHKYFLVGQVTQNSGDVTGYHGGNEEIWLIQIKDNSLSNNIESINENEEVSITPTVFTEKIKVTSSFKINSVDIYDISGVEVFASSKENSNESELELGYLKPGLYILSVQTDIQKYMFKIVKE